MGEIEGASDADEERQVSHWPEMTDGGNNDAMVDRMFQRSNAVVAPTRERLAELATALDDPFMAERTPPLSASELRWLLAQAERMATARSLLRESASRMRMAAGSLHTLAALPSFADRIDEFLAPPSQPSTSTSTSSPPVGASTVGRTDSENNLPPAEAREE